MEGDGGCPSDRCQLEALLSPVTEAGGATKLSFLHAHTHTRLCLLPEDLSRGEQGVRVSLQVKHRVIFAVTQLMIF